MSSSVRIKNSPLVCDKVTEGIRFFSNTMMRHFLDCVVSGSDEKLLAQCKDITFVMLVLKQLTENGLETKQ